MGADLELGKKTLYVSDLDGTLLRSNEVTSEYTNKIINRLTKKGMLFSYATARSFITAKKVTKGIDAKIPLIVYNGAFVIDNVTEKIMIANYFDETVQNVLDDLFQHEIYPIVYSYMNEKEKFSFVSKLATRGMKKFLDSRLGDIRRNAVESIAQLKKGDIFYITCIDEPEKLKPLYEKYKDRFHCVYQRDVYIEEQWLEIMPLAASKSNAVKQLKKLLNCQRLVVFGDGLNDIDMFELADESYAVYNAHEKLKKKATGIIDSNDEDGVARWLEKHFATEGKLGLKRGKVELISYNPKWETIAGNTIRELKEILGEAAIDIQHVGSTSIQGICAKPIIDIAIGMEQVEDILLLKERLEENKFICRGSDVPGQILFAKGDFENDSRTHHIHVVQYKGEAWNNYIAFRDYLRDNKKARDEYENLKKKLAEKYEDDRVEYTKGKKELIVKLLGEAKLIKN